MRGYRVCKTFRFEAAHFLPDHDGKCREIHGHSYRVEVVIFGDSIAIQGPKRGMLIDFGDIKAAADGLVRRLDHSLLNDSHFTMGPPTAEVLARRFYDEMVSLNGKASDGGSLIVERVRVWETEDSWAEYSGV